MPATSNERCDVPWNAYGPRSLVDRVDRRVELERSRDPESTATRGSLLRRAIRFYLSALEREERRPRSAS